MHWYKRYPGDYAADTGHLSLTEHGCYTVLLDHAYSTERPLPKDRAAIYRLARATEPDERAAVDSVLDQFWNEGPDGWTNPKADRVLAEAHERSAKARQSAEHRWKGKPEKMRTHMRTQSEGICEPVCESDANQSPESRNQYLESTVQNPENIYIRRPEEILAELDAARAAVKADCTMVQQLWAADIGATITVDVTKAATLIALQAEYHGATGECLR